MLVSDLVLAGTQRNHTGLDADRLEHGAAKLVGAACQLAPVDTVGDLHLSRVDLEDLGAGLLVGQREFDLAVQTAGTQQGRVEDVDTICRGEDLDSVVRGETVQLVEKLQHGSLNFSVATLLAVETLGAHGIQLVNEDDRRGLFLGQGEAVAYELSTITYEHLYQLRARKLEERGIGLGRAGSGQQSLSGSGGSVHQRTYPITLACQPTSMIVRAAYLLAP